MFIAEYWTDGPLLEVALERAPDVEITVEEMYADDGTANYLFWAEGGDFEAFDAGIDADPTVAEPRTLTETPTRRLYRVTITEAASDKSMLSEIRDLDLVRLESTARHEGWTTRMRFPHRAALYEFRSAHSERGFPFELRALYEQSSPEGEVTVVTEPQREALVAAYETGHYDVPQGASQREVAARLDIAPQSLSERLIRFSFTVYR